MLFGRRLIKGAIFLGATASLFETDWKLYTQETNRNYKDEGK